MRFRVSILTMLLKAVLIISVFIVLLISLSQLDFGIQTSRRIARPLVFLKVHYAGSSFIQNIFFRYGDKNNFTFVFPRDRHNECNDRPNCISLTNSLRNSNVLPPPKHKSFDILCSFAVYNRQNFRRHFPAETRYVSLLFDPKIRLETAIAFQDDVDKNVKANLTSLFTRPTAYVHPMLNNRIAFDFGFDKGFFHTRHSFRYSPTTEELGLISEYISDIMKDFDLIMVFEKLNESLVLLKRTLGWDVQDILYPLKPKRPVVHFKKKDLPKFREYLYLDIRFYNKVLQLFNEKIEEEGLEFRAEVDAFKRVNSLINHFCNCTDCKTETLVVEGTCWYQTFTIDKQFCEILFLDDGNYLRKLKEKQYK